MRVRVCILNLQSIIKVTMTSFVSLDIRFISLVNLGVIHILTSSLKFIYYVITKGEEGFGMITQV